MAYSTVPQINSPADFGALAAYLDQPARPMIGRMARPYNLDAELRVLEREAMQITYAERTSGYAASGALVPLNFN